jgi:hypothetical protein
MGAVMLHGHIDEVRTIIPELADLLSSPANAAAYYAGTVWADWTHMASNIKKYGAYLTDATTVLDSARMHGLIFDAPLGDMRSAVRALERIVNTLDLETSDLEIEHFVPGLLRYVAYLRSYSSSVGIHDGERVAFLLGLASHMYQDIVFHNDGVKTDGEVDFKCSFGQKLGWADACCEPDPHAKVEFNLDFADWLTSAYNDAVNSRESFSVQPLHMDFNAVYDLLGRNLPPEDVWNDIANFVEVFQWQGSRQLAAVLYVEGIPEFSADLKAVIAHGEFAAKYSRGGLINGASVTQMAVLLWYARIRGWYLYQNETRADYYETKGYSTHLVRGKPERKYLPYLGVTDATIDEANPTFNAGGEPLLSVSTYGKRTLIRFQISDIKRCDNDVDGHARSIQRGVTVDEAHLWLYFVGRKTPQTRSKTLRVYKVNREWNEGGKRTDRIKGELGSQADKGEVCYAAAQRGEHSWQADGCDAVPEDRDGWPPVTSLVISPSTAAQQWLRLDVTSAVQYWIDHPQSNFGLLLHVEETDEDNPTEDVFQFYSSQAKLSDASEFGLGNRESLHPLLIVKPRAQWKRLDKHDLNLADTNRWDQVQYYSTIQTQVVRRNGQDVLVLLARGGGGISTWRFDFDRNGWQSMANEDPPLRDVDGWDQVQYYSTIQTQVVRRNGQDVLVLLARGGGGISTWRFDFDRNAWQSMANDDPPLRDVDEWDQVQYYSTIQTQVVGLNGEEQLVLLARGSGGITTWTASRLGLSVNEHAWDEVTRGDPPLTDAGGWLHERYNSTIQTQTVHQRDAQGERDVIYLLVRSARSLQLYRLFASESEWRLVNDELALGDLCGWGSEKYFSTIRMLVVGSADENQQLLLFARKSTGMDTYRYDPGLNTWQQMTTSDPAWGDASDRWAAPQGYRTIQAQTLEVNGEHRVILLGRAPEGIETYQLDYGPSTRWVG